MHDDVGAQLERALQHGGGEGVVDDDERAVRVRRRGDGRDVGELERGVRGRLDPHHRGARARRDDLIGVGDVDVDHLQLAARRAIVELADRAGVRAAGRDDRGSRLDEVEHGRDRGDSGCERHAAPALESPERVFEGRPRGIGVAPVLAVAAGDVGRGEVHGHVEGLVGRREAVDPR